MNKKINVLSYAFDAVPGLCLASGILVLFHNENDILLEEF